MKGGPEGGGEGRGGGPNRPQGLSAHLTHRRVFSPLLLKGPHKFALFCVY